MLAYHFIFFIVSTIFIIWCVGEGSGLGLTPIPELIKRDGYPVETHVVDSGGYTLTVYRLPQPRSTPPAPSVMAVHGLFCSAIDYILHGRGRALGYLLHEAGLDVWLPNLRGSINSLRHKKWKPSQKEFWDFTFEEMGTEDLFAVTDYILKLTGNKKIHYISNSMGGTSMLTGLAVKPQYNKKFHQLIMFGPHSNMKTATGFVRFLSVLEPQMQVMSKGLNIFQLPPNNLEGMTNILYDMCLKQNYIENACVAIHNIIIGNGALIDFPLFIKYGKYYPTPISIKCIRHIFQTMGTDRFSRFDYGRMNNIKIYGTPYSEPYNLSNVIVPVTLIHAKNDNLVPPEDIGWLKKKLPNVIDTIYITTDDFGHSSFLWYPNVTEILYKRIVSTIAKS